jgi:hypothetical protein
MAKFEVAVYNAEVRQKVANGEHHRRFADDWADMRYCLPLIIAVVITIQFSPGFR